MEMVSSLLMFMLASMEFWGEEVKAIFHILNHSPTHSLKTQGDHTLLGLQKKVTMSKLPKLSVVLTTSNWLAMADRALPVMFLGYDLGSKAYKVHDPMKCQLYVTRYLVFE
jgi:hypothetical protein